MLRSVLWIKSKTKKSSVMGDRYDISVDTGDGKDYSVATLFENGEYRPIALSDTISFGSDVEHSGYMGVEAGELSFSAEVVDIRPHEIIYRLCGLNEEWERLSEVLDRTIRSWEEFCRLCERIQHRKHRKTTYKTIRRDCAKRNRHK